jgi:hypothetical protein
LQHVETPFKLEYAVHIPKQWTKSMSRYFGVLLGYLPIQGLWELQLYEGDVMSGAFDDHLKHTLQHDVRYFAYLIKQPCWIEINEQGECCKLKHNDEFKSRFQ